jgi:hypothetical protein
MFDATMSSSVSCETVQPCPPPPTP